MAFWGCEFIFDGLPCSEFGLMVYDFGSHTQSDISFQSGEIIEERVSGRYDSLMYGITQNKALQYTLIFGANTKSVDANVPLDRYEVETIVSWLTGHSGRKWLTIIQPDMEMFRYRCTISSLKLITYGNMPWAFSCTVSCDSPFAYMLPEEFIYDVDGSIQINMYNRSSYNGYYEPKIELTLTGGNVEIYNHSDKERKFSFEGLPTGETVTIFIDNHNQVITNSLDMNLYPYFNMKFFRMVRGDNIITINGKATVKFICEFPVDIGA